MSLTTTTAQEQERADILDRTLVPDTLRWTLDQFKGGRLAAMIGRAGYPGIVAELDNDLIQSKLPEVEAQVMAMIEANSG